MIHVGHREHKTKRGRGHAEHHPAPYFLGNAQSGQEFSPVNGVKIAMFFKRADFTCDFLEIIVDMFGLLVFRLLCLPVFLKMVNKELSLRLTVSGRFRVVWGCCGVCTVRFVSHA
jgi:hypothetical protein